ncbi:hypothetical protein P3T33_000965 [Rhizobium sp. AN67]|nr:hypothetical protein [Rhizobium sp. AN67]
MTKRIFSDPWVCCSPYDDASPAITEGRAHAEKQVIDCLERDGKKRVAKDGRDKRKQDEQSTRNQSGGYAQISSAFAIELTEDKNPRTASPSLIEFPPRFKSALK